MNIEREFIERRSEQRRAEIRAGISQLFERRQADRRADNFAVFDWIARFENARVNSLNASDPAKSTRTNFDKKEFWRC